MVADVPVWAARLRAERRERLWSQKEMARRLAEAADDHTRARLPSRESLVRMLKDWEAGRHEPSDPYPLLYCRAFGIDEADLFNSGRAPASLTGVVAHNLPASPGGHVAPELVDYFHAQLLSHYAADAFLGPRHLIGTVAVQYQSINELAGQASGEVRRDLLRLGAGFAAFAAWLCQDAGVTDQAGVWLNLNLEMAHRSGDVQLVSHALTNKAMLAADLGDSSAVIDLTNAALAEPGKLMAKTRVLALQQGAHGYALAADRARCDALLDQAAGLVNRIEDDDRLWGNACRTPNYVEIQRATCYGRLGLTSGAVALWDQILPAMPATSRRDIGVFLARQAAALAATPDPERATDAAREAIGLLRETGSVRQRAELGAIPSRMGAWRDTAKGREMAEMLADVTQ
jgi:transcriptional regulator with XRE-family HTH domain